MSRLSHPVICFNADFTFPDCFDGELDDQLRLENVLHHSSKDDRLIVVAGVRVDGEQTWEEMVQVIRRVLRTEVSKDGNVAGWPQLRLVNGGPLLVKDQKQKFLLTLAVEELKDILGNQQFVIHSNTSATYVEAVLMDPDLVQQVKVGILPQFNMLC